MEASKREKDAWKWMAFGIFVTDGKWRKEERKAKSKKRNTVDGESGTFA